jgi:hypothetical protein
MTTSVPKNAFTVTTNALFHGTDYVEPAPSPGRITVRTSGPIPLDEYGIVADVKEAE